MSVRPWLAIAVACGALAAAACDGSNLFGGTVDVPGNGGAGTSRVQGSVLADGSGVGAVPVILVGQDSTQTNASGVFVFDSLAAATYTVSVRVPLGFTLAAGQTSTRSVTVGTGGTAGASFILQRVTTVP
ncbi:MAG TPA: carboxypeptidase-like regulatory domain-containing protein [Longimicrobium sp.]|jgi:hypothetical protein